MIPNFTPLGILPPFVGADPTSSDRMSPYHSSMSAVVERFGYSLERLTILEGLLRYRELLISLGVTGFQWLSGSFVEHIESLENRHPGDVDVVTIFERPEHLVDDEVWESFLGGPLGHLFFDSERIKSEYSCDAYPIDMNQPMSDVVDTTRFWFGLFSHQRVTYLWKGMIAVELNSEQDALARGTVRTKLDHLTSQL